MNMEKDFIGPRQPLDIPLFLLVDPAETREQRRAVWAKVPLRDQFSGGTEEAWRLREAERRAARAEEQKAKNARGLERMKIKHAGERYDRKNKIWVKVVEDTGEYNVE